MVHCYVCGEGFDGNQCPTCGAGEKQRFAPRTPESKALRTLYDQMGPAQTLCDTEQFRRLMTDVLPGDAFVIFRDQTYMVLKSSFGIGARMNGQLESKQLPDEIIYDSLCDQAETTGYSRTTCEKVLTALYEMIGWQVPPTQQERESMAYLEREAEENARLQEEQRRREDEQRHKENEQSHQDEGEHINNEVQQPRESDAQCERAVDLRWKSKVPLVTNFDDLAIIEIGSAVIMFALSNIAVTELGRYNGFFKAIAATMIGMVMLCGPFVWLHDLMTVKKLRATRDGDQLTITWDQQLKQSQYPTGIAVDGKWVQLDPMPGCVLNVPKDGKNHEIIFAYFKNGAPKALAHLKTQI